MALPVVLCALVVALLQAGVHSSGLEDSNAQGFPEAMSFLDSLQNREMTGADKLRVMYEALAREEAPDPEDLPVPLPLQARFLTAMQNQDLAKDKRASYMSLCHFKICNMGRKRNYWNTWPRA